MKRFRAICDGCGRIVPSPLPNTPWRDLADFIRRLAVLPFPGAILNGYCPVCRVKR